MSSGDSNDGFDPFQIFEVTSDPCSVLYVKVLQGNNITKGRYGDMLDTPDPYVVLRVKNAPIPCQKTVTKDNDVNPEWNETFKFYVDPRNEVVLEVTLMDANYVYPDEILGQTVKVPFTELPYDQKLEKELQYNESSTVNIEIWAHYGCEPQLRFSLSLCDDELEFQERRKKRVFDAMQEQFGEDAPCDLNEVPNISVIGSGGGFRAMAAYSGVCTALVDSQIMDMVTYIAGLSGSAWYLGQLYSHPEFPKKTPGDLQEELGLNIEQSPVKLLGLTSMYHYVSRICEKRRQGQPISFTDLFGHLVGETLLKDRIEPKLSDQQDILKSASVPLPLYTCLHVEKHVSAMLFHEWMEFSPYEIGLPKYGTFLKPQLFGSKFFMGQLVKQYPEPPLHFLLEMFIMERRYVVTLNKGRVWGSAFCIQFNRLLKDDKSVDTCCEENEEDRDELVKELQEDLDGYSSNDSETSDSESEEDDSKKAFKHKTPKKEKKKKQVPFMTSILENFLSTNKLLKAIDGRAASIHSFMWGLSMNKIYPFSPFTGINMDELDFSFSKQDRFIAIFDKYPTTKKKLYVVDGGLTFNSPYPLVLRPQRQVDIILSFDFSARPSDSTQPFKEILLAQEWARVNKVPFPPIDARVFDKEGMKECYVFEDPNDPKCPTILHFALVNINFRREIKPGVPRTTEEDKTFAEFDLFDDPKKTYSTFTFKYNKLAFDRLTKLMEYNTLLFKDLIMEKIKECVLRKRDRNQNNNEQFILRDTKQFR